MGFISSKKQLELNNFSKKIKCIIFKKKTLFVIFHNE
jgi:hypothetical protein